jgi:lysophospholipase L1-like esterase
MHVFPGATKQETQMKNPRSSGRKEDASRCPAPADPAELSATLRPGDDPVIRHRLCLALVWALPLAPPWIRAAEPLDLKDGDRVVLVGSTLIEREQRCGYWETALTTHFPDRNIVFRNLGWSGDTVFGEARAAFDPVPEGFRRLKDHVLALKPTVIILGYGTNESFEGEAGLPKFVEGLNKLLDALEPAKARIVLLSPMRQEDLGPPLPNPAVSNKNLALYGEAIRKVAEKRAARFVDLYDLFEQDAKGKPPEPVTDNGMHLTPFGYWRTGPALEKKLGLKPPRCVIDLKSDGTVAEALGVQVERDKTNPLRYRVTSERLPMPGMPDESPAGAAYSWGEQLVRVHGLPEGKYVLLIDGKPAAAATAKGWDAEVLLERGPECDQVQKLRAAIIEKNRLYFHRWRPQNETYLFGFRKAEQGQNAKEIPEFDPLVEKKETEIAELRKPRTRTWEFVREGGK